MLYYCGECGQECNGITVDFGIGSYEFWGAQCNDTDKQFVSDCCEAQLFEDEALTRPVYEEELPYDD